MVLATVVPLLLTIAGVAVHVIALDEVRAEASAVEEELVEEVVPISGAARSVDEVRDHLRAVTIDGGELTPSSRTSLAGSAARAAASIERVLDGAGLTEERGPILSSLEVLTAAPDTWFEATADEIAAELDRAIESLRAAERVATVDAAEEARASTAAITTATRRGLALAAIGVLGMLVAAVAMVAVVARPLRLLAALARSDGGTPRQFRGVPSRLGEIRQLREALAELSVEVEGARSRLEQQATTDPLTGLANRAAFTARLDAGGVAAVALIDLDGFKAVNDTYGHTDGDRVLVEVARRLGTVARYQDLVARLGGDEFAIIVVDDAERIGQLATRMVALLARPVDLGDRVVSIGTGCRSMR